MHPKKENIAHPCFDVKARHSHARVHLPVAPACNIQCNYCNRKFDCVNESRPGVCSSVLKPFQAVDYLRALDSRLENLSVIGIAGPGDPFANTEQTLETMRLARAAFPDKLFCVSTNGLDLVPHIAELSELGVSHLTLTINAVDPQISTQIYKWIRYQKRIYRGEEGARILLEQQLKGIPLLKQYGITVKINSIIIPGVNDTHIPEVARVCSELGADIFNCIPMIPTADTAFGNLSEPAPAMIFKTRTLSSEHLPIMSHCARCRADAAGLLGQDLSDTHALLKEYSTRLNLETEDRPFVAVATNEGLLVNLHLGEASRLSIFRKTPKGFKLVEERVTPPAGGGENRWHTLAALLGDCRALLVSGVGETPKRILSERHVHVIEMTGLIDEGLEGVYMNRVIRSIAKPDAFTCGSSCKGNAQGCG